MRKTLLFRWSSSVSQVTRDLSSRDSQVFPTAEAKWQHELGAQRPPGCHEEGSALCLDISAHGPEPSDCSSAGPHDGEQVQPEGAMLLEWVLCAFMPGKGCREVRWIPGGSGCSGPRSVRFNSVLSSSHSTLNAAAH